LNFFSFTNILANGAFNIDTFWGLASVLPFLAYKVGKRIWRDIRKRRNKRKRKKIRPEETDV
jgi:hypothetical protein